MNLDYEDPVILSSKRHTVEEDFCNWTCLSNSSSKYPSST
ncbi:hypothetical protein LINPERPRIM_LOCUS1529 [Linum perenne]